MRTNKKDQMYAKIQKHGEALLSFFAEVPGSPEPVIFCKKLRRLEVIANRLACDYCNGVIGTEEWDKESGEVWDKLIKIIGSTNGRYCFINSDARGYALKIKSEYTPQPGVYSDWGGYGILAPDFSETD